MSNDDLELNQFIKNLHQEVIINSEGNKTDEDLGAFREEEFTDRKSTRLNSSHRNTSRMPSSA